MAPNERIELTGHRDSSRQLANNNSLYYIALSMSYYHIVNIVYEHKTGPALINPMQPQWDDAQQHSQ